MPKLAEVSELVDYTTEDRASGTMRSVQAADLTLAPAQLERLWAPESLERLARTYWRFLTRVTLGLIRVLYSESERSVVLLERHLRLLTFAAPEYEMDAERGVVRWRIKRGLLVARSGHDGLGHLQIDVRRLPARADGQAETRADGQAETRADGQTETRADGQTETRADGQTETRADGQTETRADDQTETRADGQTETRADGQTETRADGHARLHIEVEVANFHPAIATRLGKRVYNATQAKIHVFVTHGFLRSLARLDLAESKVGQFDTGRTRERQS